ncbi:MAG: hypothetical protein GKR87_08135 [Kiritimatiellae bacterium]|nr:hypothetical protein [Kiritimatiellia bacterium]
MEQKKMIVKIVACLAIVLASYFPIKKYLVRRFGVSELHVAKELLKQRLGLTPTKTNAPPMSLLFPEKALVPLTHVNHEIRPFKEIGIRLGERAKGNSLFQFRGAVIFDANNDDRLDLFFPQNGRPRARATDEKGIMSDKKMPARPCALYLNQGNTPDGDPIFTSVQELQEKGNRLYVQEELLFENKYKPRKRIEDDEFQPGRIANAAIAVDLNGDGLQDLIVRSAHDGVPFQTEDLGMPVFPAHRNIRRNQKREPFINRMPSFLWGGTKRR